MLCNITDFGNGWKSSFPECICGYQFGPQKSSSGKSDVTFMSVLSLSSVVQYSAYCGLQRISCLFKAWLGSNRPCLFFRVLSNIVNFRVSGQLIVLSFECCTILRTLVMGKNRVFLYVSVCGHQFGPPKNFSGANGIISMSVFRVLYNIQLTVVVYC